MSPIAELPPEQRAVLSLVLGKRKSYAQIATLLKIEEQAVRERAHAALQELGPRDGTAPPPQRKTEIGDYLLGQQQPAQANETLDYLEGSAVGRAWARVLASELRWVAAAELPEVPVDRGGGGPPPRSAKDRARAAKRSAPATAPDSAAGAGPASAGRAVSRRGGAIVLAAAAALIAALILIFTSGGGGSSKQNGTAGRTSSTATTAAQTKVLGQVNLTTPNKTGAATGVATVLQQGATKGIALQVTGLAPTTNRFAYAVWLYNSHAQSERVGFAPGVGADGKLGAVAPTPADIGKYRALIVTRETTTKPTRPGPIVLSGSLPKRLG